VDPTEVWRVLECVRPGCEHLFKVSEDVPGFPDITIQCSECGQRIDREHIERSPRWKYCRVCEWLQPIGETVSSAGLSRGKTRGSAFDYHNPTSRSFRSERQLECRYCKREINKRLNPRRTSDMHRESAQKRRMYSLLAAEDQKIDSRKVFARFRSRCFRCSKPLEYRERGAKGYHIDHTLPVRFLWPLSTENATLLCKDCNNEKHDRWPSEYYSKEDLQHLSVLTGITFDVLSGEPRLNPEAVRALRANIDAFLAQWIRYPQEIKRLRRMIVQMERVDIRDDATNWPAFLDDDEDS